MVMARELYALFTTAVFHLPVDPGNATSYVRPTLAGEVVNTTPLTRTEQALIDLLFMRQKNYFMLLQNIKRACFTALNTSINDTFKVSNIPTGQGWHASICILDILDQLSNIYGKPTSTALEANINIFQGLYLAANALDVLFHWMKDCAKVALLGENSYTDKQLVLTTVWFLLGTRLCVWSFEAWDLLANIDQTWIKLHRMIQEVFQ
jgi:hypothetical protein